MVLLKFYRLKGCLFMLGKAKRKYDGETMRLRKKLRRLIYKTFEVLPYEYNAEMLLDLFVELYPFEWKEIVERCNHYREKDKFLLSKGKKVRYRSPAPTSFFFGLKTVNNILSKNYMERHKANYNEKERLKKLTVLKAKRASNIIKRKNKILKYTELMQEIEPYYVDALIAAYHKKGITITEKIEIVKEMGKFICDKSIEFLYKLNDAERNNQVRGIAFKHLQNSGYYVKLRKKFDGKQKAYMNEASDFTMTPQDLVRRLNTDSIQNKKQYDVFISHSYYDNETVKTIIKILNRIGLSCYCDWSSDNDFLKRSLVSNYTKEVLKKRLEQSNKLLFLRTTNSINSDWVKFELRYYESLGKDIRCINLLNDGVKLPYSCLDFDLDSGLIEWGS